MLKIFSAPFLVLFLSVPLFAQEDTGWVRTYSGPYYGDWVTDLAVDNSGNVYVTGHSMRDDNTTEFATIKYYHNGDTAWVRRYSDSTNVWAVPTDLEIDDSGNVFITGISVAGFIPPSQESVTIKYHSNGDTSWIRKYHRRDYESSSSMSIAVDYFHNVYVTGASWGDETYDYATIKYYPNGETAWVRIYSGPANYNVPYKLRLDSAGNIYITGISYSGGSYNDYDYATIKYYPNGDTAWVRRYNGPESNMDRPFDLAVDDSGNAYVTGYSYSSQTKYDYLTIKYRANGDTAWTRRHPGTSDNRDSAMAVTVDSKGNVYVMGSNYGNGTGRDYVLIKYSPDGKFIWERRYNGTGNSNEYAYDLALDHSDNAYVTGYSKNSAGTYDLVTVKYSSNGGAYCTRRFNTAVFQDYLPHFTAIAVDTSHNVYVGGTKGYPGDYLTIKYNPIITVGDANSDGSVGISDVVYLVNYLFKTGPAPEPIKKGDINGDGDVTISDIVYLINYLFKGGPSPVC
ncbi:MAG TPA: SBBP repeat-containing protein [Terriglobales bacterium]|nr:SBBP repeat-containing protein [Terriglobales bacterium]